LGFTRTLGGEEEEKGECRVDIYLGGEGGGFDVGLERDGSRVVNKVFVWVCLLVRDDVETDRQRMGNFL
jgi:hypothetical protein